MFSSLPLHEHHFWGWAAPSSKTSCTTSYLTFQQLARSSRKSCYHVVHSSVFKCQASNTCSIFQSPIMFGSSPSVRHLLPHLHNRIVGMGCEGPQSPFQGKLWISPKKKTAKFSSSLHKGSLSNWLLAVFTLLINYLKLDDHCLLQDAGLGNLIRNQMQPVLETSKSTLKIKTFVRGSQVLHRSGQPICCLHSHMPHICHFQRPEASFCTVIFTRIRAECSWSKRSSSSAANLKEVGLCPYESRIDQPHKFHEIWNFKPLRLYKYGPWSYFCWNLWAFMFDLYLKPLCGTF